MPDNVNNPQHYQFSNGSQVVDITENLSFNAGNVVKYVARAGRKTNDPTEDLQKALFYLKREILRLLPDALDVPVNEPDDDPLPYPLWPERGRTWVDEAGDEWRWRETGWEYRTEFVKGWIPILGSPSMEYSPFKEKND